MPNTACTFDRNTPKYNSSCQCIKGNKPFDPNPRTGLIEGCAPLTDADKATILGCPTRFTIEGEDEWVPEVLHTTEYDASYGVDVGTVYVNLGLVGESDDIAILRLLDDSKNANKMYTVKWYRRNGQISISESTRTRSFFFANQRDTEVATIEDLDILTRIQTGFVGFWIQYKYDEISKGGLLSVGLNGAPFSSDYALLRWTDAGDALKNIKYMGFTASSEAVVQYGTNCVLLNTAIGIGPQNPFVQISPQNFNAGLNLNQVQPQFSFNSLPGPLPGPLPITTPTPSSNQNPNVLRQQIRPGAKPWQLDSTRAMELQIVTEPQETIIEPVIRNQYLTKLKRLLPSFFDGIPKKDIEAIVARQRMEKEMEEEFLKDVNEKPKVRGNYETSTFRAIFDSLHEKSRKDANSKHMENLYDTSTIKEVNSKHTENQYNTSTIRALIDTLNITD